MIDWKALWESVKEPLRVLLLAVISYFIVVIAQLPYKWAVIATVVLRIIDGYLHEVAVKEPASTRNEGIGGVTGLTGF
jgi:hypothetical protein